MIAKNIILPSINLIPEEYRRRLLTRKETIALVFLVIFVIFASSSYMKLSNQRSEIADLNYFQAKLNQEKISLKISLDKADLIRQDITKLKGTIEQQQKVLASIPSETQKWDPLIKVLLVEAPQGITITIISREENRVTVEGASKPDLLPLQTYLQHVSQVPSITSVIVNKADFKTVDNESFFSFGLTVYLS